MSNRQTPAGGSQPDKPFVLSEVDDEMQETLNRAEEDVRDGDGGDPNSYGAGYDTGYRDAMRRALCILRGLDPDV